MNPPSDMKTDLTIEERALAQRLARLGPHGEPSPALDARILAAAHDAVARTQARRQRRRWPRRWKSGMRGARFPGKRCR